jgi:hypothetical protein
MIDEGMEFRRSPTRCHLSAEELDAAVVAQLEQRAEQGFGEVPPIVLSRVSQIVATVGWQRATSAATHCSDDRGVLGRAA